VQLPCSGAQFPSRGTIPYILPLAGEGIFFGRSLLLLIPKLTIGMPNNLAVWRSWHSDGTWKRFLDPTIVELIRGRSKTYRDAFRQGLIDEGVFPPG
jgi:hypothetical protein